MARDHRLVSNGNPMGAVVRFDRAVRGGPFAAMGGTAPAGSEGRLVRMGDVAMQTRRRFGIVRAALEEVSVSPGTSSAPASG